MSDFKGQMERYDPKPDSEKAPLTIKNNAAGLDMSLPANTASLNSAKEGMFTRARKHLERDLGRGE